MKRTYFKRFYIVLALWLFGLVGNLIGNYAKPSELTIAIFWMSYFALQILGIYLLYLGFLFVNSKIQPTGNYMADAILQISLYGGFGAAVVIGLMTELLPFTALIVAPIFVILLYYNFRKAEN